jgi:hypothetical protein
MPRVSAAVFVVEGNYALAAIAPTSATTTTFGGLICCAGSIRIGVIHFLSSRWLPQPTRDGRFEAAGQGCVWLKR